MDEKSQDVQCPFCGEQDFDLIGLKHHFGMGRCHVYNTVEPIGLYAPLPKGEEG